MGRKIRQGQPQGNRSASGRLRDRTPRRVTACDGVLRKRAFYGVAANDTDTCDAIGRAYAAGLLGHGEDGAERASRLLNAGRRIAAQYWRVLGFHTPDSLARFQPSSPSAPPSPEDERIREDALNDGLALVQAQGRSCRFAFDQLVIDPNPDHGPAWLDRLIWARKQGRTPMEGDNNMLRLAVKGLEALA